MDYKRNNMMGIVVYFICSLTMLSQ